MTQNQRPTFYEGQFLSADDLDIAVAYERFQLARHELGAHIWGIGIGLDLRERALPSGDIDVSIVPGIAWDGYGRAIVVTAPIKIPVDKFANYQSTTPSNGLLIEVWLRYDETTAKGPAGGFEACTAASQYARAVENYAIEVGEPPQGAHGSVSVAGLSIDPRKARNTFLPGLPDLYDESVAYQEFPESGSKPQWWIPIGYVRWLKKSGQPGSLIKRDDSATPPDSDLIRAFRQYVGVVAESVFAADGAIRLRNRADNPSLSNYQPPRTAIDPKNPPENDLVSVEGSMRVFGDARIAGGLLEFRNDDCVRDDVPQLVRRRKNDEGGLDLQAVFTSDEKTKGDNAFSVGTVNVDSSTGKLGGLTKFLVVRDNGNVGINAVVPKARVQIDTLTVIDEGGAAVWSNFGSNAYYNGSWNQVKDSRPGVNLHMSSDGGGTEFRFLRVEANGANRRNIAAIGTKVSFIKESLLGVGNDSPATQLHVKTLTTIDEGVGADGTWANFGQNAYYDGTWKRIDNKKAGASLHINPDGSAQEFRFLKVEKDGSGQRNIAVIGTGVSYIGEGLFGVGTNNPQATLDVDGRVLRKGKPFSSTGVAPDNGIISLPWGDTDDWSIFVSPNTMGQEEPDSENDNALLMIRCSAAPLANKSAFQVVANYKYKFSNGDDTGNGTWFQGWANWLLVPR